MSNIKQYTLIKMSDPGFELKTIHLNVIQEILENYICDTCKDNSEDIYEWLGTYCGAEFIFEEQEFEQ